MHVTPDVAAWRSQIGRHLAGPLAEEEPVALVQSDVGPLLFPGWDQVMRRAISANGCWEPEEALWVQSRLVEGMVALDIGANVGYHAVTMGRAVGPSGRVVALEPDPLNYRLLRTNLLMNNVSNVLALNCAAGEDTGWTAFSRDPVNAGDHRAYRREGLPESAVIEVPIVRLDELLADTRVDFVLSDTQSYDHKAIAGMERLVRRWHPTMLVEFWTEGLLELGEDPEEIIGYYRGLGYRVSILGCPSLPSDAHPRRYVDITDAAEGRYVSLVLSPEVAEL